MSSSDVQRHAGAVNLCSDRTLQAAECLTADAGDRLVLFYTDLIWSRMDLDLRAAPSILLIDGYGYTLPTMLLEPRPAARALAVEIAPLVTSMVREASALRWPHDRPRDRAKRSNWHRSADGRVFLNETELRFDAVVMDAFSSASVPAHLATCQTYARLREIVDRRST
ncbi:spermidine synthase [Paracoccus rhizosphaerae]|uniref:Spermidine synthase n=1 Tax=Paracoccus rhizosphaerae TaxID=1133347 RepID=A0ABV6CP34_9RHOB|nr:fused MFS/spermidine synthase [Paracoccus rhizosphaerae]